MQEYNSELCDNYSGETMENKRVIGDIIKYIRKEKNYTQEELASKINIGRSTLSDYEREKTDINFDTIRMICEECGYDLEFINRKTKEKVTVGNINRKG